MSDYCTRHKRHDCECIVVGNEVTDLRAEVRDLKARLKALNPIIKACVEADELDARVLLITNLKYANWRKP